MGERRERKRKISRRNEEGRGKEEGRKEGE